MGTTTNGGGLWESLLMEVAYGNPCCKSRVGLITIVIIVNYRFMCNCAS